MKSIKQIRISAIRSHQNLHWCIKNRYLKNTGPKIEIGNLFSDSLLQLQELADSKMHPCKANIHWPSQVVHKWLYTSGPVQHLNKLIEAGYGHDITSKYFHAKIYMRLEICNPKNQKTKQNYYIWTDESLNLAQSINRYCFIICPYTFSNKDTTMLEKQGKAGTRGFKATRGAVKICRSTNWEEGWLSNPFGEGEKDKHSSYTIIFCWIFWPEFLFVMKIISTSILCWGSQPIWLQFPWLFHSHLSHALWYLQH